MDLDGYGTTCVSHDVFPYQMCFSIIYFLISFFPIFLFSIWWRIFFRIRQDNQLTNVPRFQEVTSAQLKIRSYTHTAKAMCVRLRKKKYVRWRRNVYSFDSYNYYIYILIFINIFLLLIVYSRNQRTPSTQWVPFNKTNTNISTFPL